MSHAYIRLGGNVIPFIGVPPSATEEKCDKCGETVHIQDIVLTDKRFECLACLGLFFNRPKVF